MIGLLVETSGELETGELDTGESIKSFRHCGGIVLRGVYLGVKNGEDMHAQPPNVFCSKFFNISLWGLKSISLSLKLP